MVTHWFPTKTVLCQWQRYLWIAISSIIKEHNSLPLTLPCALEGQGCKDLIIKAWLHINRHLKSPHDVNNNQMFHVRNYMHARNKTGVLVRTMEARVDSFLVFFSRMFPYQLYGRCWEGGRQVSAACWDGNCFCCKSTSRSCSDFTLTASRRLRCRDTFRRFRVLSSAVMVNSSCRFNFLGVDMLYWWSVSTTDDGNWSDIWLAVVDVSAHVDVEALLSFGGLRGFSVFTKCVGKLKIVGTASTTSKNNLKCHW